MVGSEFRPWLLRTTSSWVLKSSQNRECATTLGKPRLCLRVRKFLPVQGWNISSFQFIASAAPAVHYRRASWLLATLTCILAGRWWVLSEVTSSLGFTSSPQPRSPSLSSGGKSTSPRASWGPMLNLPPFINICFVLRGPKTEQSI